MASYTSKQNNVDQFPNLIIFSVWLEQQVENMHTHPRHKLTDNNPSKPYQKYPGYKQDTTKRFFTRVGRRERMNVRVGWGRKGRQSEE